MQKLSWIVISAARLVKFERKKTLGVRVALDRQYIALTMTTMDMIDEFIETLKPSEGSSKTFKYLSEQNVIHLCQKAKEILMNEANVQPVRSPVTIVVR